MVVQSVPSVRDYPPLVEWLDKHHARCQWSLLLGDKKEPQSTIESWIAGNSTFVVIVYADKKGWDVYTSLGSNSIQQTLTDAEQRLGFGQGG